MLNNRHLRLLSSATSSLFGYTPAMSLIQEITLSPDAVSDLLLACDIRPTAQRVKIVSILLAKRQHLSADQVMSKVNQHAAVVSKATVYNTLNLLSEKGLLRQVIIKSGKVFYDSNTDQHHHIFNEDTGELLDISAEEMLISNLPDLPEGTVNSGVDVIIRVRNKE